MNIDAYLELPYHVRLVRDSWADGRHGWFAEVEELPGCMTQAETLAEVETAIHDAMRGWIAAQLDNGGSVPLPREDADHTHSGRFLARVPRSLHAQLAAEADAEGVSLNAFVTAALSAAIGWRAPTEPASSPARPAKHMTPDEIAVLLRWTRQDVIRFAHEHSVPIYHGRIDRALFQAVFDEVGRATPHQR
jgi:antitoxin HicB